MTPEDWDFGFLVEVVAALIGQPQTRVPDYVHPPRCFGQLSASAHPPFR